MKLIFHLVLCTIFGLTACSQSKKNTKNTMSTSNNTSFYDFEIETIDGNIVSLDQYKGKKVLLVNVASKCGYTPQYEDLQALHDMHGDRVAILGFPANNFGGQEPGSNEEIAQFCSKNYGVTFPMFSKISVKGDDTHPLYQWLSKKEKNGFTDQAPTWNFCKYLVDEDGKLIGFYPSSVNPFDEVLLNKILE